MNCEECADTYTCQHCGGDGYDPNGPPGASCPVCGGSGICPYCQVKPGIQSQSFFSPDEWKDCPPHMFKKIMASDDLAGLLAEMERAQAEGKYLYSPLQTIRFRLAPDQAEEN
jgi:hypothetical protein